MGRRTYEHPFFSLMRLCSKYTTAVSIAAVFFKKTAIIIAIHGQKTSH